MKGIVYALTNPSMPGLVKIGKTTDLDNRMKQLYGHAGVPAPFSCIYAREVDDMDTLEKGIHDFLSNGRANERREFFCTDEKEIIKLFLSCGFLLWVGISFGSFFLAVTM